MVVETLHWVFVNVALMDVETLRWKALRKAGIAEISDCSQLNGLTIGAAVNMSTLPGGGGE
jgi:hypothetical protein